MDKMLLVLLLAFLQINAVFTAVTWAIDAGSSGTRIYKFGTVGESSSNCPAADPKNKNKDICKEKKWTPGFAALSSTTTLETQIVAIAGSPIPGGATAGLRNLWAGRIEALTSTSRIVKLLPGTTEAMYEWFSVNTEYITSEMDLSTHLSALQGNPNDIRNFFSAGGASAQIGAYIAPGVFAGKPWEKLVAAIGTMQAGQTDFRCTRSWQGEAGFQQDDFIALMSLDINGGYAVFPIEEGKDKCGLKSIPSDQLRCILLVSFLAGQSSDADKECIEMNSDGLEYKKASSHNLFGGAKETIFNLAIKNTLPYYSKGWDYAKVGTHIDSSADNGMFALSLLGDWLKKTDDDKDDTERNKDQVKAIYGKVRELLAADAFFATVTHFISITVEQDKNVWYGGGAIPKAKNLALPASVVQPFGWTAIYARAYYDSLGINYGSGKTVAEKGPREGDWAYGVAVTTLRKTGAKTCGFPVASGCAPVVLTMLMVLENEINSLL